MNKVMTARERLLAQVLKLPAHERLQLAQKIWESVPDEARSGDFTAEQKVELDRRLREMKRNPSAGSSWEDVEARILKRR